MPTDPEIVFIPGRYDEPVAIVRAIRRLAADPAVAVIVVTEAERAARMIRLAARAVGWSCATPGPGVGADEIAVLWSPDSRLVGVGARLVRRGGRMYRIAPGRHRLRPVVRAVVLDHRTLGRFVVVGAHLPSGVERSVRAGRPVPHRGKPDPARRLAIWRATLREARRLARDAARRYHGVGRARVLAFDGNLDARRSDCRRYLRRHLGRYRLAALVGYRGRPAEVDALALGAREVDVLASRAGIGLGPMRRVDAPGLDHSGVRSTMRRLR